MLHPRQVISINPTNVGVEGHVRKQEQNDEETRSRKIRKENVSCDAEADDDDEGEEGDEKEVTPEEGNENYDVIVVDMDPLVDELVEIRALLERLVYHVEERWNVDDDQKAKSP